MNGGVWLVLRGGAQRNDEFFIGFFRHGLEERGVGRGRRLGGGGERSGRGNALVAVALVQGSQFRKKITRDVQGLKLQFVFVAFVSSWCS